MPQGLAASAAHNSPSDECLFPTFLMAGFECSTFLWKDGRRKDYVALTGHDIHVEEDYDFVMDLGIGAVREGVRWPFVDKGRGRYDWSAVDSVLDCLNACHIAPIWDLCHYGFPDGVDPFSPDCLKRFTDYCRAAADRVVPRTPGPHFFTPVNEITFFSDGGTNMGWMYPFAKGRHDEFKRALCRMAIEGARAIREVDPAARMVHVDPIIHSVPPADRPDLAEEARREEEEKACESWDILAGRKAPELGGSLDVLDIVGVNTYLFSQAEMAMGGERKILGPQDSRRKPLSEQLQFVWERYHRPIIIGETSGWADKRAEWLNTTMEECMKALAAGVDLQGICLFPCIDIPDWNSGEWAKIGIADVNAADGLARRPCEPYIAEIRRWQKILERPQNIEPDASARGLGRARPSNLRNLAQQWVARRQSDAAGIGGQRPA